MSTSVPKEELPHYGLGYKAFGRGLALVANPYDAGSAAWVWFRFGWDRARKHAALPQDGGPVAVHSDRGLW